MCSSWARVVHHSADDPWGDCVLMFWNSRCEWVALVTRQHSRRENAAPHKQAAPAAPRSGAPIIRIEEPNTTRPIKSPVRIRVTFQPASNATIVVNSLRVRYGSLGIDITRRILAHARPTASGVTVDDAELPRGRHRVTIQIADNLGRVGTKSLQFTVV